MSIELTPEQRSQVILPEQDDEPVFAAPWEASAFALTMVLFKQGYFTWQEWVATFSQTVSEGEQGPGASRPYYESWSVALERMIAGRGLLSNAAITTRTELWREAYLTTPHGQEVFLNGESAEK